VSPGRTANRSDLAIDRDRIWRPHPEVVAERLGEAGVLVDLRSGAIFELNATGLRIWELLVSGTPRIEIVGSLAGEFSAPPSEIEADVDDLLQRLSEARLIQS
jgi:hypothetical protein